MVEAGVQPPPPGTTPPERTTTITATETISEIVDYLDQRGIPHIVGADTVSITGGHGEGAILTVEDGYRIVGPRELVTDDPLTAADVLATIAY